MTAVSATIEKHHQAIISALLLIIVFFVLACALNGTLPICHYLFGCDHAMH